MKLVFAVVLVVASVFAAAPSLAQVVPAKPRVVVIDIDAEVIEAEPKRPAELPLIVGGKHRPQKSLIRLRTDFRAEVLSSVSRL